MAAEDQYDLKPVEKKETPKPGEPGWVEPVPVVEKADVAPEPEAEPVDPDVEKNKAMGILAYILFLIPLLAAPQSKFARFHANQGLLVFILWWVAIIGVAVLHFAGFLVARFLGDIWILWAFFSCLTHLLQIVMLVGMLGLTILGIVNASNGEKKPLPVIGQWILIK